MNSEIIFFYSDLLFLYTTYNNPFKEPDGIHQSKIKHENKKRNQASGEKHLVLYNKHKVIIKVIIKVMYKIVNTLLNFSIPTSFFLIFFLDNFTIVLYATIQ